MNVLFNSLVFDFILKKKLSGIDLTQSVINQVPVPNIEQTTIKIKFNGYETSIKQHISLLVFSLLKNDGRLNSLFESLQLNSTSRKNEARFEIIRKIDLFFMSLYKLSDSELELLLATFSKQYSKNDLDWFADNIKNIQLNEPICPSSSLIPHLSPN